MIEDQSRFMYFYGFISGIVITGVYVRLYTKYRGARE